jgi:hypothetical protein
VTIIFSHGFQGVGWMDTDEEIPNARIQASAKSKFNNQTRQIMSLLTELDMFL